jgi:hypothetical protein
MGARPTHRGLGGGGAQLVFAKTADNMDSAVDRWQCDKFR